MYAGYDTRPSGRRRRRRRRVSISPDGMIYEGSRRRRFHYTPRDISTFLINPIFYRSAIKRRGRGPANCTHRGERNIIFDARDPPPPRGAVQRGGDDDGVVPGVSSYARGKRRFTAALSFRPARNRKQ